MQSLILPFLALFLGAFTQSVTGFGSALVAMSILPSLLGLPVAAPVVAATGFVLEVLLTLRYHQSLRVNAIWRMLLASLLTAPFGVILIRYVNESLALFLLGLLLVGYALYALIGLRLPNLAHPAWGWVTGLLSGLLGGAYNTPGPPIVIYGNCRGWESAQFKSNLSGFFVINSIFVVTSHFMSGHYSPDTTRLLLLCLPATLVGFVLGQSMDRWLDPEHFRKVVLVLLIVLGIHLMIA